MKFLLSWLKEYIPNDLSISDIVDAFNDLGLVVEKVKPVKYLDTVVIARVNEVSPIKGADRIKLAKIDYGGKTAQVVSGAPNLKENAYYPYAPPKTVLENGVKIERRRFKDVESFGMLLSVKELGLGDEASGLFELTSENVGQNFFESVGVLNDFIFELDITPNRGDAMSLLGIARDLAAKTSFNYYEPTSEIKIELEEKPDCEIADKDLAYRLTARMIKEVNIKDSPDFIKVRLVSSGLRPINHIVDVTNYVMLELGQPSHAYDLKKLEVPFIKVRGAYKGEQIESLDGYLRVLGEDKPGVSSLTPDVVIADYKDNPVGVGGVIGGKKSEISDTTTEILLEVANFEPLAIARTSRRLQLRTEASVRFERGVDFEIFKKASDRVAFLIKEFQPSAKISELAIAKNKHPKENLKISIDAERINKVLGAKLSQDNIVSKLRSLGFEINLEKKLLTVSVPTWRSDIAGRNDLAEEVARVYGLNKIASRRPLSPHVGSLDKDQQIKRKLGETLVSLKFAEVINSGMLPNNLQESIGFASDVIKIANPLNSYEATLRVSLLPGLIKSAADNFNKNLLPVRLYEIGEVFKKIDNNSWEEKSLLALVIVDNDKENSLSLLAQVINAIARNLQISINIARTNEPSLKKGAAFNLVNSDEILGKCGIVSASVCEKIGLKADAYYLELEVLKLAVTQQSKEIFLPSRFPSSEIDLAFVVKETQDAGPIQEKLKEVGGHLVERVFLFDVFSGAPLEEGFKNLAFRIRLSSTDKTLNESEIAEVREKLIKAVEESFSARLR